MSAFSDALAFVLKWEGGFTNDPDDHGGPTNFGVTQGRYNQFLRDTKRPWQSVKKITRAEAEDIYRRYYWVPSRAAWLQWPLCLVVFDVAVNSGVGRSNQFINQALGISKALAWIPIASKKVHEADPKALALKIIDLRDGYYRRIGKGNQAKFLRGWLNRNNDLRKKVEAA